MSLTLTNVEAVLVSYLNAVLTPPVSTRVPNPRPTGAFVRVQRVGGTQRNMVQESVTVLVECWAPTELAAWETAADAYGALHGRNVLEHNGVEMSERVVDSPVNYPDPSTTLPRYQFTANLTVSLKETTP